MTSRFLHLSFQPCGHHGLESFIVWIADTTKKNFQIWKNIIVAASKVSTVCRVILLYGARVTNSKLGNCNLGSGLQCHI